MEDSPLASLSARRSAEEKRVLLDGIFEEVLFHVPDMMIDPFGNYLFQKLLVHVTALQRSRLLRRIAPHLVLAALNVHGTRSVQKVVEVMAALVRLSTFIASRTSSSTTGSLSSSSEDTVRPFLCRFDGMRLGHVCCRA